MNNLTPHHILNKKNLNAFSKVISVILVLVLIIQSVLDYNNQKANANAKEDSQAPTAPANFTIAKETGSTISIEKEGNSNGIIASVTGSAITFVWDESTDNVRVEGYEIFCENNSLGTTDVTNFTYSSIDVSPKQFYVIAFDGMGNKSEQSNYVKIIMDPNSVSDDKQEPSVPVNITAEIVSESELSLQWEPSLDNIGVEGYEVYKNDVMIGLTKEPFFIDAEYNSEVNDMYYIVAYDLAGNKSQKSDPANFIEQNNTIEDSFNKTDRFIIKYKNNSGSTNLKKYLKSNTKSTRKIKNKKNDDIEVILLDKKVKPDEFIAELKGNKNNKTSSMVFSSDIEYIQPDYQFVSSSVDPYFEQQWGIENNLNDISYQGTDDTAGTILSEETIIYRSAYAVDTNVTDAWELTKGNGSVVAVLDTGIDITHEDLVNNIWTNSIEVPNNIDDDGNGYIDDITGWNFIDDNNIVHNQENISDEWHGTHIAGIIAAQGDNNIGITGVAPNTMIMPLKVFHNGIAYTSDIIEAIEYAEQMGVKIVNCSWGSTEYNQALKETIDNSSMLFVCAAGNSHNNIDFMPIYPASYENSNIISVASIDNQGILSGFTNYGELSVDVAAPGENIISTAPGNTYISSGGTSMATAFVSGEAALLLSYNNASDSLMLKNRILDTADKLSTLTGKILNGNKINCSNAVMNMVSNNIIQLDVIDINNYSSNNHQVQNNFLLYSNGTWIQKAPYPEPCGVNKALALNGKIYGFGGRSYNDIFLFDPVVNRWSKTSTMKVSRFYYTVASLNGKIYVFGGYNSTAVEEYDPSTNTWIRKADMPSVRVGACSVVVNNIIYVIGGADSSYKYVNTVYAFNPATNTWSTKASMNSVRYFAAASVVNGNIYVAGGFYTDTMEMYDPNTDSWTFKSSMIYSRYLLGMEAVNGKLYAIGGYSNCYIEEYSPISNSWSPCPNMPYGRSGFGTAAINNVIYTIAGTDGAYAVQIVEAYTPDLVNDDCGNDIASSKSISVGTETIGLINYAGDVDYFSFIAPESGLFDIFTTGSTDTMGYIYNGDGVQLALNNNYDSNVNFRINISLQAGKIYYIRVNHNNNSTAGGAYGLRIAKPLITPANLTSSKNENSITILWNAVPDITNYDIEVDGVIYNCSGTQYVHSSPTANVAHTYRVRSKNNINVSPWSKRLYITATGSKWELKASMPEERQALSVANLNGKIYVAGGYNGSITTNRFDEYNLASDTWTNKASMLSPRANFALAAVNGKVYAIGGYYGMFLDSVEEYNPATNTWTYKASMPTPRSDFGIAVMNGLIYVIGGHNGTSCISTVEVYNPATNTWTTLQSMPTARNKLAVAVVDNKLYAIGGYNNNPLSIVEEYDPITNSWSAKANMLLPRFRHGATTINGKIYIMGGYNYPNGSLNTVEVYSPLVNTWVNGLNKLLSSFDFGVTSINSRTFIIGGYSDIYGILPTVETFSEILVEYIYDDNNRLVNIVKGGVVVATFYYDKNGNLLRIESNQ